MAGKRISKRRRVEYETPLQAWSVGRLAYLQDYLERHKKLRSPENAFWYTEAFKQPADAVDWDLMRSAVTTRLFFQFAGCGYGTEYQTKLMSGAQKAFEAMLRIDGRLLTFGADRPILLEAQLIALCMSGHIPSPESKIEVVFKEDIERKILKELVDEAYMEWCAKNPPRYWAKRNCRKDVLGLYAFHARSSGKKPRHVMKFLRTAGRASGEPDLDWVSEEFEKYCARGQKLLAAYAARTNFAGL